MIARCNPDAITRMQLGQWRNILTAAGYVAVHQVTWQHDEVGLGGQGAVHDGLHIERIVDGAGMDVGQHGNAQPFKPLGQL